MKNEKNDLKAIQEAVKNLEARISQLEKNTEMDAK
jgi:hypothetical protein